MNVTSVPHWLRGAAAFQAAAGSLPVVASRARQSAPNLGLVAELVNLAGVTVQRAAWDDLTERALEPNVFMESAFLLAAVLHMAVSKRPKFLLVWNTTGTARRLVGLCPVQSQAFARIGAARVWLSKQSCNGSPLLDKSMAVETLRAMADYLSGGKTGAAALAFSKVPQAGKVAAAIRELAAATGRELAISDAHMRAALVGGPTALAAFEAQPSLHQRKELRRKRLRLEAEGAVRFETVSTPQDVRPAIEEFLKLEASGWKGRCGTAFLSNPGQAAFVRTLSRDLARQGKCRVDTLLLNDRPVAMGIVLNSGGLAAFWKTTYDETFAAQSPGVLLCHELSRLQLQDGAVAFTDSCAIAHHPMINGIWRERIEIADMLLAARAGGQLGYGLAHARASVTASLRMRAKSIFYWLSARKMS